ncbi:MAG: S-layer homology domain-containing protein [Clostridiales bacterium]|nr:S-layer homology domain-containing protein [Clostridiales bacterium]
MTGKIKADMPQSLKEFDNSVTEQLVLTAAHLPDGAQNLKDVLDAFGEGFGIKGCSLSVCQKIMGVYYKDMSALKTAIENASNTGGSSESGGSKGGSGSGGFGGGGIGKTTTDTPTVENPKPVDETASAFDDIDGVEWAREAINYLAAKGIVSGKAEKTFAPNDNITREEFVKILVSAFGINSDGAELDFSDVSKDDWFYPYLSKAVASGVVSGYDNGRFGTGDCITRQDICVMIQRIMQKSNVASEDSESNSFGDFDDISEYARESVSTMSRVGIVSGNENKMFLPHDFATRAETAKMVYKAVTVTE